MNTEQAIEAFNNRQKVFNDRVGVVDILEVNISHTKWGVSTICTVRDYIEGVREIEAKFLSLEDPRVYEALKGSLLDVFDHWMSGYEYSYQNPINFPRRVGKTNALDKIEKEIPGNVHVIRLDKHRNYRCNGHFLFDKSHYLVNQLHRRYAGRADRGDMIILGDEISIKDMEFIMSEVHLSLVPLRSRIGFVGVCTEPEVIQNRWF